MANKSFGIARRKGRQAAREGKPETANPYGTEATNGKRITFARRFFLEWRAGHREISSRIATPVTDEA